MDRRYQVFVSSTFDDLREQRASVIGVLLQMDCFLAGMELFPAADDDSWTLIKNVIADSDYYLVVLAGRYGSVPTGETKSYTHLEYEYALSIGKPTIALLHNSPDTLAADKTERSDEGRSRLDHFRESLRKKTAALGEAKRSLHSRFHWHSALMVFNSALGWWRSKRVRPAFHFEPYLMQHTRANLLTAVELSESTAVGALGVRHEIVFAAGATASLRRGSNR